jgi:hypothetical protein
MLMNTLAYLQPVKMGWLVLHSPSDPPENIARWRINGFPASIVIWTAEEWELLAERPADAQRYPCGVWCALRMD